MRAIPPIQKKVRQSESSQALRRYQTWFTHFNVTEISLGSKQGWQEGYLHEVDNTFLEPALKQFWS